MTTTITFIVALFSLFISEDTNDCEVAYQDATLSYQHVKKSMEANNLDHIKQYADRAKVALEKSLVSLQKCGCSEAENASFSALDHLEKALEKETFEKAATM